MSFALKPVLFGEVLYDCFPDGKQVLGGAPFNVAWHLQGFAVGPLVLSSVGSDPLGDHILDVMAQWGMLTDGVYRHPQLETGSVSITLQQAQPSYTIHHPRAYDEIPPSKLLPDSAYLCHGSLALRQAQSKQTLQQIRSADTPLRVLMDVNLRAPWWDISTIQQQLMGVDEIKLNDEELTKLTGAPISKETAVLAPYLDRLREENHAEQAILTMGSQGAMLVDAEGMVFMPAPQTTLVDTVGAGDGLTAVWMLGGLLGWPTALRLQRAIDFAAAICTQQGATCLNAGFYQAWLTRWQVNELNLESVRKS
ncbi:PfkB family carbohydrate kinase [Magnetococcus sp. PR-3]|uniref:PfkB family carbohydrate kinase n=1 Tax=Magnetococcus sp. PR-3 TaxID=3120355 RepID=UPI002FCE50FD